MLEQPNIELKQLHNVTPPTLVIAAEDGLYKPKLFESIVTTMPDAELLIMKGHEHDSYVVGQDILYSYLKGFLRR